MPVKSCTSLPACFSSQDHNLHILFQPAVAEQILEDLKGIRESPARIGFGIRLELMPQFPVFVTDKQLTLPDSLL